MQVQQRFYAAVGRVASECSRLEDELRHLFGRLINDNIGLIVTSGEDLSRITKMCRQVAPYSRTLSDDDEPRLFELLHYADELRERRNIVVHAQWSRALLDPKLLYGHRSRRAKAPNTPTPVPQRPWYPAADQGYVSIESVRSLAEQFIELTQAIADFQKSALNGRDTFPPMPRGYRMFGHPSLTAD